MENTAPVSNRSLELLNIAEEYATLQRCPGLVSVYAGGSVGRGEADLYSDIDLMFWHRSLDRSWAVNTDFGDALIQAHHYQMPTLDDIRQAPWEHRFILDAAPVLDPTGAFSALKHAAREFLGSRSGQEQLLMAASGVVGSRNEWARSSVAAQDLYTAGMATMAAWTDASMLYAFQTRRATSTGNPLGNLPDQRALQDQILQNVPVPAFRNESELRGRLAGLRRYRSHLRTVGYPALDTDPLNEDLVARKVDRLADAREYDGAVMELYNQTYMLVLAVWEGNLDRHLDDLPADVAESLAAIGFRKMDISSIEALLRVGDEIMKIAQTR